MGSDPGRTAEPAVSVVLPVHDERENLAPLFEEIRTALRDRRIEIVAVDDASSDGSDAELARLAGAAPDVRVLRLGRRSGQSAALAAGWVAARAPVIVTLDADGQNDPADIPRLLGMLMAEPSLEAVVGFRVARRDGGWKRLQAVVANRARDVITGHRVRDTGCGLKVIRRRALVRLPRFDGMHRFLPTLLAREGARVAEVAVSHRPRRHGRTKYGMWNRAFRGLRDALGVRWLRRRTLTADWEEVT
ncbi:MAG: glycosyltransferase [Gemmatimonadota bacterium]|nr:glycosyltransferase [Gemmatimonadota bacterium]